MAMVEFSRYVNIGEALVAVSALEAGGFHPVYHNYYHAHNAYLYMMALGGLIVLSPEQEYEDAHAWLEHLRTEPKPAHDPIAERKYGMWKHAYSIAAFHMGPAILFIPFLWLRPLFAWILFSAGVALLTITMGEGYLTLTALALAALSIIFGMISFLVFVVSPRILLILWFGLLAVHITASLHLKAWDVISSLSVLSLLFPIALLWHAQYIALPRLKRKPHVN